MTGRPVEFLSELPFGASHEDQSLIHYGDGCEDGYGVRCENVSMMGRGSVIFEHWANPNENALNLPIRQSRAAKYWESAVKSFQPPRQPYAGSSSVDDQSDAPTSSQ